MDVTPGTPSGDGDWCVGAEQVTLRAHAVDAATQTEITEGMIWWQFCVSPNLGAFPKEDCDATGPPRWRAELGDDLSVRNPSSITFTPNVPVMGLRVQYRPTPGGKRTTSVSFNLDTTCGP